MFVTQRWRDFLGHTGYRRTRALHDLYGEQLATQAKFVRSFTMVNQSKRVDYFLFFATQNLKGLERMKEAMWKVDPLGDFCFSDATDPNALTLFGDCPEVSPLRSFLKVISDSGSVTVDEIFRRTLIETPYLKKHVRQVLKVAEEQGSLEVHAPASRRRSTFPEDRGITVRLRD